MVDKQGCAMVKTNAYSAPVRAGNARTPPNLHWAMRLG